MSTSNTATEVLGSFFAAFGQGDIERLVSLFADDALIAPVREGDRADGALHGSYRGQAGAREFVATMGATFDTQAFAVDEIVGGGAVAFASGTFTHLVRRTGRPFTSQWAARIVAVAGRIAEFRFYEDSAAYDAAAA